MRKNIVFKKSELHFRRSNIRRQLDYFRVTEQPELYRHVMEQLSILISFTDNQRERAAYQSLLNEYSKCVFVAPGVAM